MSVQCHHIVAAIVAIMITMVGSAIGREESHTSTGTLVESEAAEQTTEQIRVQRTGTVVALFVKPGDSVKKGQVLGHTELDQTKLSLDTAIANLQATGTMNQMYWQHQAMISNREEAEENVRKRLISKNRLQNAISMEKWAESQYRAQKDLKNVQQIQYDFYKNEYESRIFRAPFDGVVTDVKVVIAQSVGLAYHAFTISNDTHWTVPVTLSESSAEAVKKEDRIPLRNKTGGSTIWGTVAGISDQFTAAGLSKVVRLLVDKNDIQGHQSKVALQNMKFDVIVPTTKGA